MNSRRAFGATALLGTFVLAGCGGSNGSSSSTIPTQAAPVHVRIADGAPLLEALVNGIPTDITPAYVKIGGNTISNDVSYGTITNFTTAPAGTLSITALNIDNFVVGPLKTPALAAGGHYTLVIVGTYPNYQVVAFQEPAPSNNAQISLYEAAPSVPQASFGRFTASTHSNFKQLGSAKFGAVTTASLGSHVTDIGGYVGTAQCSTRVPVNCVTPLQLNSFDTGNALPFHAASRLSLFLFDVKLSGTTGPVFGSLDK